MEKKKKFFLFGIVVLCILMITGVSFALWSMTLQQTNENVITTGCFKIEFSDKNPINLEKAYPISDEEGKALVPYEFTIINTCNSFASFQINLEILNSATLENLDYLKVMLEDKTNLLTEKEVVTKTLDNAKTSYKLKTGYLRENQRKTFSLRLWMDEDTPTREEFMNKIFESKVTVIATYKENLDNTIEVSAVSQNESFSGSETFQIHATSENYDLISMSDDLDSWEELEIKGKDITVEKTVTKNGSHTFYFQDEAENVQEVTVAATKIDDKKPIANMSVTKSNNVISINASNSLDNETSISKYYYSKDGINYIESTNSTYEFPVYDYGVATTMLENYKNQKVYVKVEDEYQNISDVAEYSLDVNELLYDETIDNNLRYVGANPNNYVWFGGTYKTDIYDLIYNENNFGLAFKSSSECESFKTAQNINENTLCKKVRNSGDPILWRIIGIMNHIKSSNFDKDGLTKVKIIRNDSIGSFSWDTSTSTVNAGKGINEWEQADLNTLLNDFYYYGKSNQTCYVFHSNKTISYDFSGIKLEENLKTLIDDVIWNIGTNGPNFLDWGNLLTSQFYELERSSNTGKICTSGTNCNDTVTRTSTWLGKIALIYPSDYGYAVGKNVRNDCINSSLYQWSTKKSCDENNWLSSNSQWTLMPIAFTGVANEVFAIYGGGVNYGYTSSGLFNDHATSVKPTVYLNSDVKITSGLGTEQNPFNLSLD